MKKKDKNGGAPVKPIESTITLEKKVIQPGIGPKAQAYVNTMVLAKPGVSPDTGGKPRMFEATIEISKNGIDEKTYTFVPAADPDSRPNSATKLEKKYYQKTVRSGRGIDKYRFFGKLLSGGMGEIFQVLDQDIKRILAMKVVLQSFKDDEDALNDFVREAKITGLLEHPNIIPVHDLGLLNDAGIYFTMKLAHGEPLNVIVDEIRVQNTEYMEKYHMFRLLNIFRKVCDALSFAHSKDIIHRDIKPHNIMVGKYGEVLLMDWGLAKYIGDCKSVDDPMEKEIFEDIQRFSLSQEEVIKGSPPYMSPEQVKGDPALLDKHSDIFLMGATLYHMFTLYPPYFGEDIYEVLHKAENRDLIPPDKRNPARQIPEEICRIIMKAMAAEKSDRYRCVEDLAEDIDDVISGKWSRQEKRTFKAGDMLMREGEIGAEAYLIISGKVQVFKETKGQRIILSALQAGDMVGEMALITNEPRSASVEAVEETEVAVLTDHLLNQNLKKLPPFMEKMVSTLTARLGSANKLLADTMRINIHSTTECSFIVLNQLRFIFKERSGDKLQEYKTPVNTLADEISVNLEIPVKRVKDVLEKAVNFNFITIENSTVRIRDLTRLSQFINFGKMVAKIPWKHRKLLLEEYMKKNLNLS